MTNAERFAQVYTQAFIDSYPQLPAEHSRKLIEKAVAAATHNIRGVLIDGAAFKLTAKRLGIKHTYESFEQFFSATGE